MATLAVVIFVLVAGGIVAGLAQYRESDEPPISFDHRDSPPELHNLLHRLSEAERRVLAHVLHRQHVTRDATADFHEGLSMGERVADKVAAFGGSWSFIWMFISAMLVWMAFNIESSAPFDPYPFILLNLCLSCVAALQAPVIMMSQNRQSARDRAQATNDYEVNLKAEMEVATLHTKFDELRERHWQALIDLQEQQLTLLRDIAQEVRERSR